MPLTSNQLKRLGQRLAQAEPPDPTDLDLLDEFERSFDAAQDHVVRTIREQLCLDPTARRKTRRSIVAKIRRQHTALSRMQDIAGCRLVVEDIVAQNELVERLRGLPWEMEHVDDRRERPSNGYRAVHVIVTVEGRPVEIQVRSRLQDAWAQISEKLADLFGLDVKYGGGPRKVQEILADLAESVAAMEERMQRVAEIRYARANDRGDELEALAAEIWEGHSAMAKQMGQMLITLSS